ncbi:MAG: LysE family translocator [Cyanobacteria bacterium P01_D01_bin.44]
MSKEPLMSYLSILLSLAGIWAIVVISPGPCFVATVQYAVRGRSLDGMFVALGIAVGTILWCISTLLGLAVLFITFSGLYHLVRLAGALYLFFLGIKTLRSAHKPLSTEKNGEIRISRRKAWQIGFLTDIGNPKAAVFFGSLFATLLPPDAPLWVLLSAVAIVVVIEFVWYCVMANLFALQPVASLYRRAKRWVDCITDGIYVLLGGRLAVSR